MKKSLLVSLVAVSLALPGLLYAADYTVRPFLIDDTLVPRDIESKEILLTNTSNRQLTLYATVNEITVDTEGQVLEFIPPIESDRTTNVTSWIEITRGRITIPPGGATTTNVTFRVHPSAEKGEYHAFIGFTNTNKRYIAEEAALSGDALGIPVKITIADTAVTDISISKFTIPRFIFNDPKKVYELLIANSGETNQVPSGEVIFYDTRGVEIASTKINEESRGVSAAETVAFYGGIPIGDEIGRFKANATVRYGESGQGTVIASADFFLIPLHIVIIIITLILVFTFLVTYLLKRAFDERMIVEHEEVDLEFFDNRGFRSEDKDHDITITKN